MRLNFSRWERRQRRSLDLRGTKAFRTSPENLPGEHPGTLGEDRCCCPRAKQERLHEEVQGKTTCSSVFSQLLLNSTNVMHEQQHVYLTQFCPTGTGGDG